MKVRDSDVLAWVPGQRKMSQVIGAFGLLDFTMLQLVLAWCSFWNLWNTYFYKFPIFFRAAVNRGSWTSRYGGTTVCHTAYICNTSSHFAFAKKILVEELNWRWLWPIRPVHRFQCNPVITHRRAIVIVVATLFYNRFPSVTLSSAASVHRQGVWKKVTLTLPRLGVAKASFFTGKRVANSPGNHSQLHLKWQSACLHTPQSLVGVAFRFLARPRCLFSAPKGPGWLWRSSGILSIGTPEYSSCCTAVGVCSWPLIPNQGWSITTPTHAFMTCSDVTSLRNWQSYTKSKNSLPFTKPEFN
jgi:hypothetical protein